MSPAVASRALLVATEAELQQCKLISPRHVETSGNFCYKGSVISVSMFDLGPVSGLGNYIRMTQQLQRIHLQFFLATVTSCDSSRTNIFGAAVLRLWPVALPH